MKKLKIIILGFMMIAGVIFLTGCNRTMIDTNYTFNKAIVYIGNEKFELNIRKWCDYDGEQLQIETTEGKIYLVSSFNTILIKD